VIFAFGSALRWRDIDAYAPTSAPDCPTVDHARLPVQAAQRHIRPIRAVPVAVCSVLACCYRQQPDDDHSVDRIKPEAR
jgi:hypothetical protein